MKWNNETGYLEYITSLNNIKSSLGISQIDYIDYICELAPYVTYILKYINKRLIILGEEVDISTKLQEIFDIHDMGARKIISGQALDLARELGISDGDVYIENEEIPYNQDRFIFSWADVLSSLVTRLKLQYSTLLTQPVDLNCPCDCAPGQTFKDYESWTSGVYPEDESYTYYDFNGVNKSWRVGNENPVCTNCLRK